MYRMKQLLGDSLTLRDYDGQVAEAMAMVRALNRMTKAGMPESVRIAALLNKSNFAELKDQITHLPDNADRSVAKQKFKITNWPTYNKALINRGSITFWLDDEAIQAWYESATPSSRGRPQRYSDLAITTVLVIKRVFRLTLRAAQGFIDSILH